MANRTTPTNATPSEFQEAELRSKLAKGIANKIQIYADFAVWDTVANKYLSPFTDYFAPDIDRR